MFLLVKNKTANVFKGAVRYFIGEAFKFNTTGKNKYNKGLF